MNRFSLRTLLIVVAVSALVLWVWFVPRGRINRSTVDQLKQGMPFERASELIGLEPGWYDGTYGFTGLPHFNDKGRPEFHWVNLNGAVTVQVDYRDQRIVRACFTPRDDLGIRFHSSAMIYDRSLARLVDSQSPLATLCILSLCAVIPTLPSLIISRLVGASRSRLLCIGVGSSLLAYAALVVALNSARLGHHDSWFGMITKTVSMISLVSTILYSLFSYAFTRAAASRATAPRRTMSCTEGPHDAITNGNQIGGPR